MHLEGEGLELGQAWIIPSCFRQDLLAGLELVHEELDKKYPGSCRFTHPQGCLLKASEGVSKGWILIKVRFSVISQSAEALRLAEGLLKQAWQILRDQPHGELMEVEEEQVREKSIQLTYPLSCGEG